MYMYVSMQYRYRRRRRRRWWWWWLCNYECVECDGAAKKKLTI